MLSSLVGEGGASCAIVSIFVADLIGVFDKAVFACYFCHLQYCQKATDQKVCKLNGDEVREEDSQMCKKQTTDHRLGFETVRRRSAGERLHETLKPSPS